MWSFFSFLSKGEKLSVFSIRLRLIFKQFVQKNQTDIFRLEFSKMRRSIVNIAFGRSSEVPIFWFTLCDCCSQIEGHFRDLSDKFEGPPDMPFTF